MSISISMLQEAPIDIKPLFHLGPEILHSLSVEQMLQMIELFYFPHPVGLGSSQRVSGVICLLA